MACILLWSSAVRVHDSQAYRKMDVTREPISRILELREILLSIQIGFSLVTLQDSTSNSSIDKAETSLDWQEYFAQLQDTADALPCYIHLPVCLYIMDPHSRVPKKNTSHGNEVLPQDTTHLIKRPCHQRGSPCQDPAGNWTTWIPPDHRKETQTAVVWSCSPLIRSGQNQLPRHSERGKKTRRTK